MLVPRTISSARFARFSLLAAAVMLVAAWRGSPPAGAAGPANAMQIVVHDGPVAGTYRVRPHDVLCVSTTNGVAASYKYFVVPDATKPGVDMRVRDGKTMSEAQVIVDNPKDAGPKRGSLELTFGNRHEHGRSYLVFAPGGGAVTQTTSGPGLAFAFTGRTKDGVAVDATATCRDIRAL